ncbi:hypothetical protein BACCIP111883_03122 [Sutcliffiella rhizosphaerae]|uniref:Uncharacterized protein n=1 Tax=Sutcliffiella rhizosphaerae TaxID=2880967 RepID=A0ABM8YQQ0_9BACI|nr:hypothetical protein BACCIP111883_03122 [Sutcliffiella rhizosphaerae]
MLHSTLSLPIWGPRLFSPSYSGFLISSTFTVAGTVLAFHQIPFSVTNSDTNYTFAIQFTLLSYRKYYFQTRFCFIENKIFRYLSAFHYRLFGKNIENVVPSPSLEWTEIVPLCASTIFLTIASPSPVPACPRVLALSAL